MSRFNTMRSAALGFILLLSLTPGAQAGQLLLVFDNNMRPTTSLDAKARSQMILRSLQTAEVKQAAFLIDTYDLDAIDEQRLAIYSDTGHLLVNKGHNQTLVSKKNLYSMQANLLKADEWLLPYPAYKKHVHLDWLNENSDVASQSKMIDFLREREFQAASSGVLPMRAVDDYLNQLYQKRKKLGKPVSMEKLQQVYVKLILDDLQLADTEATLTLGYSPVQILTLHENDVTAYCLLALLDALHEKGWYWINAEQAYADPVANPYGQFGFATNSYRKLLLPFIDDHVRYARVIGDRKNQVDQLLQTELPDLLQ
jgi:hypothetical protein